MLTDHYFLYVEDDPMSREVMILIMEMVIGTDQFTIFETSADFMARVRALPQKPSLILLDIRIKPHSGFEMLAMLRDDGGYEEIPVVALTASVMNEQIKRLQEAGFDGAIGKPLNVETLPTLLERIVAGDDVWSIQ